MATPIITPSSAQFLSRDVIFIFKLLQLKTKGYDSVPRKGLYFIMKALFVSVTFHVPDNNALVSVEHIIGCHEPYQISYLHHAYSIARLGVGVNSYFNFLKIVSPDNGGELCVQTSHLHRVIEKQRYYFEMFCGVWSFSFYRFADLELETHTAST